MGAKGKGFLKDSEINRIDIEWGKILLDYRTNHDHKMAWHEYLSEFYYPPTRIK